MNKVLRFMLIIMIVVLALFMLAACGSTGTIVSIEVDPDTIESYYDVNSFDVGMVFLIITYDNEQTERIPLSMNMIKAEDHAKLLVEGDQTITVTYKQKPTTFTIKLRSIADRYQVRFFNEDKSQLGETQFIEPGGTARAPSVPEKFEYVFGGWKDQRGNFSFYDNIDENKDFYATFVPDFCMVTFIMTDGSLIDEIKIKKGTSVTDIAPNFPVVPGQTATGWNKSLDNITEDVTITAVYIKNTINVYFVYGDDGRGPKAINYDAYTAIDPAISPVVDHAEFLGWYTSEDFSGQMVQFPYLLRNEITFYAKYVSKTIGSDELEYSDTGSNTYEIVNYSGDDSVIVIPEKHNNLDVVSIRDQAFKNAKNSRFYVTDSNNYFSITDGVLFDAKKEKLISYPAGKNDDQYALPSGVKSIENYAFANAKNLLAINFPTNGSLTEIKKYAFQDCTRLLSITIPNTVERIHDYAFSTDGNSQLSQLSFQSGSMLKEIGEGAFKGLNKITSIELPSRLETMGSSVFYGCQMLSDITLEGKVSDFFTLSVDGVLYDKAVKTLIAYPSSNTKNSEAAYVVESGVTTIKSGALINASITGLVLPDTINQIENNAIESPNLQYIQFKGIEQPENLGDIIFGDGDQFRPAFIIIPAETQNNFSFFNGSQFIEDTPQQTYYYNAFSGYLYTRNEEHKLNIIGLRKPTDNVIIPSEIDGYDVYSIGKYAFYNNRTISNVTLSEGIEIVSQQAFRNATKLQTVTLPNSLKEIASEAFADCVSLNSIVFSDEDITIEKIGLDAFIETPWYKQTSEEYLTIGNILIKYNGNGEHAFVTDNIKTISDKAFLDKSNLKTVTLNQGLEYINSNAFFGCSGLIFIEIPASIKYIGEKAFSFCPNLYRIVMKSVDPPELSATGEIFTTTASYVISNVENTFSIIVPYDISQRHLRNYEEHPQWGAYKDYFPETINSNSDVTFRINENQNENIRTNAIYQPYEPESRPGYVFAGWYAVEDRNTQTTTDPIIFPKELDGGQTFYARWFTINEGVSGIEYLSINGGTEYAVSGYTGDNGDPNQTDEQRLRYVVVPSSYKGKPVTKVLANAFSTSNNSINAEVYKIILPTTITSIEKDAFIDTKWYRQSIGDFFYINNILIEYRGEHDEHVVIPEHIEYIVPGAFQNNSKIKSIHFPENIRTIPSYCVYNCSNLLSVVLPDNLEVIEEKAFADCEKLNFTSFPSTITEVAPDALLNTYWYNNFVDDVVTINSILYKYKGREAVLHVPNTITRIEKQAFIGNIFIQKLYFPNTIITIGERAFEGCINIKEIIFAQNTNIRTIENNAFFGCLMLEIFSLGTNRIETIGDYAFSNCARLTSVDFSSTLRYLGEGAYSESGIVYINFAAASQLEIIQKDTFKNCRNLKTFSYGGSSYLKTVSQSAFENCSNLMSVIIPDSNRMLTDIGMNAFKNCVSLINVVLPSSLMEIGDDAFVEVPFVESNSELLMTVGSVLLKYTGEDTEITISKDVAAISKAAFKGNEKIQKIIFEEGSQLFAIGEEAFMNCENLIEINFPLTLSYIGSDAFLNTKWLNEYMDDFVIINDILIKYRGDAYQAIIPNNVTTIGIEAFKGNTKLRNIEIGPNVERIMAGAFNDMASNDDMYDYQSTITMLRTMPPLLDEGNLIVSKIYVENQTVFNNYRENEVWAQQFSEDAPADIAVMIKYTVTFNLVYENEIYSELQTNVLFDEPIPEKAGHTFIGWYKTYNNDHGPQESGAYDNLISLPYPLEENTVLYAKWIENTTGTISSDFRTAISDSEIEGRDIIEYAGIDKYVMIPATFSSDAIIGIARIYEQEIDSQTGLPKLDGEGNPIIKRSRAFSGNESIEEVSYVQGSQLEYILEGAFENCINLRRIVLPSTLRYIGKNAFANCTSLEEVIFTGATNALIIDEGAFYGCSSLKSITFPDKLTSMGIDAFKGCTSLTSIYMSGDIPPTISNNPFEFNDGLRIYINRKSDDSVLNAYRSQWSDYEAYIFNKPN